MLWAGAHKQATSDPETLARWEAAHPGCAWRVAVGPSGVWALDVDAKSRGGHAADGLSAFAAYATANPPLPPHPRQRTGGGGVVMFFSHAAGEPIHGKTGWPVPGIDPRRGGQPVTVPPSLHHRTRRPYRWILPPWELAPPPAPAWVLALVAPPPRPPAPPVSDWDLHSVVAEAALDKATLTVASAGAGSRNGVLFGQAYWLGRWVGAGLIGAVQVARRLGPAAERAGLEQAEIRATLESGIDRGKQDPIRPGDRHG